MESLKLLATVLLLLTVLSFAEPTQPIFAESELSDIHPVSAKSSVVATQALTYSYPCHRQDIVIQQYEVSGVGIPIWQVQVINLCTNPRCTISQVIVQCGAFHSPRLVNPHVFRILDPKAGTCIVTDGNQVENGHTVTFEYQEIMKESLTLKSAKVTCW